MVTATIVLILFLVLISLVVYFGRANWNNSRQALKAKLFQKSSNLTDIKRFNLDQIENLPEPVQGYFKNVLKEGAIIINTATVYQDGGFRASPDTGSWSSMKATQTYSAVFNEFVWDAEIKIVGGLSINIVDSYLDGQAGMRGKVLYLIPLIDASNRMELNEGALMRYLAEAVWFPTALLPSEKLSWRAIDDNHAEAELVDGSTTVSVIFEFNEQNEIISVYSPNRYRETSGKYVKTPWKGYFSNYVDFGGYSIPKEGRVEWHLDDKVYQYWRAELVDVQYN